MALAAMAVLEGQGGSERTRSESETTTTVDVSERDPARVHTINAAIGDGGHSRCRKRWRDNDHAFTLLFHGHRHGGPGRLDGTAYLQHGGKSQTNPHQKPKARRRNGG